MDMTNYLKTGSAHLDELFIYIKPSQLFRKKQPNFDMRLVYNVN